MVGLAWVLDLGVPESISASYYSPLGGYFVGTLCAIGVFLYCYRYAPRDNVVSNVVGALIVLVALVPTAEPGRPYSFWNVVHVVAATLAFLGLAYFSYALFPSRAGETPRDHRDLVYRVCGVVIVAALVASLVDWWLDLGLLFWFESIAVWAFAFSWLVKGAMVLSPSR